MGQPERRALTRARLVEAAIETFAAYGYEAATVNHVAAAAGLSKGAFYFNFHSKEDILLELVRVWAVGRRASASGDGGANDIRAALFRALGYLDDPHWPPLVVTFWAQAQRSSRVASELRQAYRDWTGALLGSGGISRGAGALMLALHDGWVAELSLRWPERPDSAALAEVIDAALTGIAHAASTGGVPEHLRRGGTDGRRARPTDASSNTDVRPIRTR